MVTEKQAKKLREIIGPRHVTQISMYLIKNELFNRFGEPYTTEFISRIFNGRGENTKMEQYIWDFAAYKVKQNKEEEQRRKETLEERNNLTHE